MATKSQQLQIRVTPREKAAVKRQARRAGQDVSAYVLGRLLPAARRRFEELLRAVGDEKERRFALAELNDLLTDLAPVELRDAVAEADLRELSPYLRNYVAAMVEQAAHRKQVVPPAWVNGVEPLEEPHFGAPLSSLRLHLLYAAPVPFVRRNIFVDSSIGDRT
ncbi:MAG TPA: hypothetical protein VMS86_12020 [Thermoanaerobaculia bacterium]|nr:hypothetical protein [Thermoanaerobaculia bacterium]